MKTTYRIESTINSNERTNSNIVAIMIAASLLTTYMKNTGTIHIPTTKFHIK